MLVRIVRMEFRPDFVPTFLANFETNKNAIRHFQGCLHLELLQDADNPAIFTTYSHWQQAQDLDTYRHSELFKSVWAATKIGFAAKPIAFSLYPFIQVS
ncbi:putative quinol monooxygenase [Hugenholtzia roseola]|uniref:putative quinol monooxygenase n=1 Tax=Hugenholtzia roseola TaxID=1002 RepID=UPI0003FED31B|nr:antibiotic biosynthesis monooxygenase family protein [Hugenholtzia roseola]